jgi:hypothetical protein
MKLLDALKAALLAKESYTSNAEVAPAVVLWPDGERLWEPALPILRQHLPQLWTLGDYDPALHRGPAPWVKWRLGKVAPADPTPVLYLPGLRRAQFRALEDFPKDLKPLAELQFRGEWWTQDNHKDWTPLAFLSSAASGLGLNVAEDAKTVSALKRLLPQLLDLPLEALRRHARLEAEHLFDLLFEHPEDDLLRWLDDAQAVRDSAPPNLWAAFCDLARHRFTVDLERDGVLVVAERLAQRQGAWTKVWAHYAASVPRRFERVHLHLEKVKPASLFFDPSTLPQHNDAQEALLRTKLAALADLPEAQTRARVRALDAEHGPRREWVWARLGRARLATVLGHLVTLADATEGPVPGATRDALAQWYATEGYRADEAALRALSLADHADREAIHRAVRALYVPWLQRVADALRAVVDAGGYPKPGAVAFADGTCLLFADGLRWDVGMMLVASLQRAGVQVDTTGRWVAFPPVTGTSKPDLSPIRHLLSGGEGLADFTPSITATGKTLDSVAFQKLVELAEVQVLEGNETGDPSGRAWTEFGDIDKYGHKHGCKTARHVADQLRDLEQRIQELLDAGWQRVRVTTDHGWLLVPDGMPTVSIPAGTYESRWGRCAVLKASTRADLPTLPWSWDTTQAVTYAPGITAFRASTEYAHGGLTLQECYTPVLTLSRAASAHTGAIDAVKWVGLRCKATVTTSAPSARLDLRTKVNDPTTSLLDAPRAVGLDGTASMLVARDDLEGTAAFMVLLAADGAVLAKRSTTLGGDA